MGCRNASHFLFKVVHLQYGEGELKTNLGMLNIKTLQSNFNAALIC
jgi:hypothetical protein